MDTWDPVQVAGLLEVHRAEMLGVAVAMLGYCPDAEDAVQDASLTAVAKIGQLRDAAAAGPWLQAITRNVVRMRWRAPVREVAWDAGLDQPPRGQVPVATPEQLLEQHELRDWVWSAIDQLSPTLQLPVLLRYFSSVTTYDQIAAACDIPVGTVRSRLSAARAQLHGRLSAGTEHWSDGADWSDRAAREAQDLISASDRGEVRRVLPELMHAELELTGPQGQHSDSGRELLAEIMDSDQEAGVRQRLMNATSSRAVTVLECRLVSPSSDPGHCPPSVLWLLRRHDGRVGSVRLYHPRTGTRATAPAA